MRPNFFYDFYRQVFAPRSMSDAFRGTEYACAIYTDSGSHWKRAGEFLERHLLSFFLGVFFGAGVAVFLLQ